VTPDDHTHVVHFEELVHDVRPELLDATLRVARVSSVVWNHSSLLLIVSRIVPEEVHYPLLLRGLLIETDPQRPLDGLDFVDFERVRAYSTVTAEDLVATLGVADHSG
jgi:hypothetical protein